MFTLGQWLVSKTHFPGDSSGRFHGTKCALSAFLRVTLFSRVNHTEVLALPSSLLSDGLGHVARTGISQMCPLVSGAAGEKSGACAVWLPLYTNGQGGGGCWGAEHFLTAP